jgi:hypothetical protein
MKISPVAEGEGLAEFIELPWQIYSGDRSWIPPLREQIFYELSGAGAFSRYGRMQLFLCEADGRLAGRIAALVNPKLVDRNNNVLGQLGYFECIDDSDIAAGLINAGMDWLRAQNAGAVLAPMNGGAHRSHRLMTRGFDLEPFLFEPRNPPYYPKLFERCGFMPVHHWFSYELNRERAAVLLNRFERVLTRRPPPGRIEELPLQPPEETAARIHRLLDPCWGDHFGYTSLELDEFVEVFRGGLSIMSPGNISVFAEGGRDVGFALIIPDYAADVRALQGHVAGWGRWLGQSRPRRVVLHTAALIPEARKSSAAMAQVAWGLRHVQTDGFEDVVVALVVEGFLEKIGDRTRDYALYMRP